MRKLIPTTKFKKDLKRYSKQPTKMQALLEVLKLLANEQPIPKENKPQ